jgi:LysR family transcriptional regulator, cyn operon transcriptional activator
MPVEHDSCRTLAFVNLQQLRYLVATADHGTMTRAATACHVGQPALTRAVRALERELSLPLLARHGRRVELTPDGRDVVEIARRILADVDALERLGRGDGREQVMALAATPTIQADLGSGLISDFWLAHPEHPVRFVHCESRQAVSEAVANRRADAGISDLPVDPALVAVPFEHREVVIVAPPDADLPDPFPVDRLGELPLVMPTRGGHRRAEFDALFAELGITPQVAFESDERSSWTPAVLAGVGCCVWYRAQGDAAAALGATVLRLDRHLGRSIGVIHRPGPQRPPVHALIEVARTRAEANSVRS